MSDSKWHRASDPNAKQYLLDVCARTGHEARRAYFQGLGFSIGSWDELEEGHRSVWTAIAEWFIAEMADVCPPWPAQVHQKWCALTSSWEGPVVSESLPLPDRHPFNVPYARLKTYQQAAYGIYVEAVRGTVSFYARGAAGDPTPTPADA
jgi:hypothetical protein